MLSNYASALPGRPIVHPEMAEAGDPDPIGISANGTANMVDFVKRPSLTSLVTVFNFNLNQNRKMQNFLGRNKPNADHAAAIAFAGAIAYIVPRKEKAHVYGKIS